MNKRTFVRYCMARSKETFGKKEREKRRLQKRKEKEERKAERKEQSQSGAGLDDMMVYLDENGNFTNTPPDENAKPKEIKLENIQLGAAQIIEIDLSGERTGKVDFFNHDKGFGFIIEHETNEKYFVHINNVEFEGIDGGDRVVFELEDNIKGANAVRVKKAPPKGQKAKPAEEKKEDEGDAPAKESTDEATDSTKEESPKE